MRNPPELLGIQWLHSWVILRQLNCARQFPQLATQPSVSSLQRHAAHYVVCIWIPLSLSASALIVLRVWFRCVTYLCPSVLLHLAHMPRRFSGLCPPPASIGVMWSTCVLGALLQTVQVGCSRSMTVLFFLYSGSLCCLLMVLARRKRLAFGLLLVLFHVGLVSAVCVCFVC